MHVDMKQSLKEKMPSVRSDVTNPYQQPQQDQLKQAYHSKESIVHNPEEIEEGPTLALLLIGNIGFKNMTYLNQKMKKNENRDTDMFDSSDSSEEEKQDEIPEEKNQLISNNDDHSLDYEKKIKNTDDIFFQTDRVQQDNEMDEIPSVIKSHSSIQKSQNMESRQNYNRQQQNSPSIITSDKQQTIQSLKDYGQKMLKNNSINTKSEFRNSNYTTTKSLLFQKQSTNLTNNLYIRNSSSLAQTQDKLEHLYLNNHSQQQEIQQKPLEASKNLKDDFVNESIFGGWFSQTEEIMKEEIENAKLRLEIESTSFYFEFMSQPTKQQLQKLLAPERKKQIQSLNGQQFDITKLPYGINLLIEYLRYYNNKFPTIWIRRLSYSISFIRQIYFVYVKLQCMMLAQEDSFNLVKLIAINIFFAFFEFTFWAQVICILLIYFNDLRRKVFILNQMSHLISPKRVEIELEGTKKIYPTLELICSISLRTWAQLRKMTLDYGEKFTQRIQILCSIFISFFILIFVIYLLQRFEVINFFNIQSNLASLYMFDIICIVLIIIKCVFMGGKINEHFNIHIQKLYSNKLNFVELLSKYNLWFQEDYVLTNPCFRRLIEDYQKSKQQYSFTDKQLQKLIKENIQLCKMQILDINIQSKDNPYKVFGVAMTQQLGFTILTALVSLIGSLFIRLVYQNPQAITQSL